jgi:hypothetical protein
MLSGYNTAGMVISDLKRRNGRSAPVSAAASARETETV